MLTRKVTDDDHFINLSSSAQALYLHLSMSADDDGFCNQVSSCMFRAHASVTDLQALLDNKYLIQFENGVIVIKHWRMANSLRSDRHKPTNFQEELARLELKDNGAYTLKTDVVAERLPDGCQMVAERLPQYKLSKDKRSKTKLIQEKNVRAESEPDSAPAVITIPLNDGSEYAVKQDDYNEWLTLYPAVDVMQELRKMRGWSQVNGAKRKTRKGIKRFIVNWLAREQDKPHAESQRKTGNEGNPFLRMLQESEANDGTGNTEDSISFEGGIPDVLPGFEGW